MWFPASFNLHFETRAQGEAGHSIKMIYLKTTLILNNPNDFLNKYICEKGGEKQEESKRRKEVKYLNHRLYNSVLKSEPTSG